MATLIVPMNDKGYYEDFVVQDATGTAYPLTDYTIKLKVWNPGKPGTLIVNSNCAPVNVTLGTCRYTIAETDFTVKGTYSGELELTKTGVVESTVSFPVEVKESG